VQPAISFEPSKILPTPQIQPQFGPKLDTKLPLSAPIPQRAKKSPILNFQLPLANNGFGTKSLSTAASDQSLSQHPAPFVFSGPTSSPFSAFGPKEIPKDEAATRVLPRSSPPELEGKKQDQINLNNNRRQSLFERQEKLLHDEITRQEQERKSKLDLEEKERQKVVEMARQQNLERQLLREKESARLQNQKMATRELELRERAKNEEQKAQQEKNVQFYSEEIVDSIMLEHILGVNADVLAIGFYRKWLLAKALRHLKKVCTRSVRRKKLHIERIAQSRLRKNLLSRALAELDRSQSPGANKKPRRRSHALRLEDEDAFEEILLKVVT
jgi:hypothetical protein